MQNVGPYSFLSYNFKTGKFRKLPFEHEYNIAHKKWMKNEREKAADDVVQSFNEKYFIFANFLIINKFSPNSFFISGKESSYLLNVIIAKYIAVTNISITMLFSIFFFECFKGTVSRDFWYSGFSPNSSSWSH